MQVGRTLTVGTALIGTALLLGAMKVQPVPVDQVRQDPMGDQGDMTFCELFDLRMEGREGSTVGASMATTSWNIGNGDLMWFGSPDNRHPFIVLNMYRLENDRFEQIGQSWIKHGFYALGNTQCGGSCTWDPGHYVGDWLGQNCTDTYYNSGQSGFGPRHEVNPWTGEWNYAGSYFQRGIQPEDDVDRFIEIDDTDLDRPNAEFFGEGYYVILDDVDVMNNASWKSFNPTRSGNNWNFNMSNYWVSPNIGFAIDAWPDARQTMVAQELPVIEFVSPDGRSIIAAKSWPLANGMWRYEYAILNIDMDRKVGGFHVPIPNGTVVTNMGMHAVPSRNETYSNDEWAMSVGSGSVSFTTPDNPIRWGNIYNFWFDANAAPDDVESVIEHYETGAPATLNGLTWGPGTRDLAVMVTGSCPGQMTAKVYGGTPGSQVAIVFANGRGSTTIPSGPCAGTTLDLNSSVRQVGGLLTFDGNGVATSTINVPSNACGGFIQAITPGDCATSNVHEVE